MWKETEGFDIIKRVTSGIWRQAVDVITTGYGLDSDEGTDGAQMTRSLWINQSVALE